MNVFEIRGQFGIENLVTAQRPEPQPGAGQVAVRVRAAALNFRDVLMVRGHYNPRQPLPLIPLSDGMGEIVAVGDGVDRWNVGDRVAACFTQGFTSRPVPRDGSHLKHTLGGSGTLTQSINGVRAGGDISVIGILSGGKGEVNITPVLMRNIRLQGVFVGSRDEFEDMNRAIALHQLRPVVDRTFAFDESPAAFEYLASGEHFGKVCISLV